MFEPQQESLDTSSKALAKEQLKAAAVSVIQLMDAACRERFLGGVQEFFFAVGVDC